MDKMSDAARNATGEFILLAFLSGITTRLLARRLVLEPGETMIAATAGGAQVEDDSPIAGHQTPIPCRDSEKGRDESCDKSPVW